MFSGKTRNDKNEPTELDYTKGLGTGKNSISDYGAGDIPIESEEIKNGINNYSVKYNNPALKVYDDLRRQIEKQQLLKNPEKESISGSIKGYVNQFGIYNSENKAYSSEDVGFIGYKNGYDEVVKVNFPNWSSVSRENRVGSGRQDQINLTPLFTESSYWYGDKTPDGNHNIRDLVKFAIQGIHTDNPSNSTFAIFRAYLTQFSDSVNSQWNDVKYAGRGNKFYIYDGFDRKIQIGFKVAALYANESINIKISEVYVWTTADPYPRTSSYEALDKFRKTRPTFNGDLAHLCALGGQGLGGVAWLGTLCVPGYNYGYSNIQSSFNNAPTYSWTVMVCTHELGHNLGSEHSHSCTWQNGAIDGCYTQEGNCAKGPLPPPGGSGTIMSYCHLTQYGINFNLGFGQQPGDKIRSKVAQAACLLTACNPPPPSPCNFPLGLIISEITQNTAKSTWQSVSGIINYAIEYKANSSSTWNQTNTTALNYIFQGLAASTIYNVRIKSICAASQSNYSSIINFTTLSIPVPTSYCATKGLSSLYEWISRVKIGTVDRSSGRDNGFINTGLSTILVKGTSNIISFQSGSPSSTSTLYWKAWIDFNRDNDFVDPGEQIISTTSKPNILNSLTFAVPLNATLGNTKLRISMRWGAFPPVCGNYSYGEIEQFDIIIK